MDRPSLLRRSEHTEQALSAPRPVLRGRSHLAGAAIAVPGAVGWVLLAPGGLPRLGVAAFAGGIAAMLATSSLLHLRRWSPATHERLLRLDHTGIFLAIAGTGVAVALLGLQGWPRHTLLAGMLVGATTGVVAEWLPYAPPRGLPNTVYLTLGWLPVVLLPWLWMQAGALAVVLLVGGGALYTVGAVIVGTRRPDPLPAWFGYHELFHVLVLLAVVTHGVMVARLVLV